MYSSSGVPVGWFVDSDFDIDLQVGEESVWLTQEDLEEMLKAIREAKETR
jgi:hypothetical protein